MFVGQGRCHLTKLEFSHNADNEKKTHSGFTRSQRDQSKWPLQSLVFYFSILNLFLIN